ncbi:MAG: hypothetical protein QXO21_05475 [Candidatus Anstonellales archaeon]
MPQKGEKQRLFDKVYNNKTKRTILITLAKPKTISQIAEDITKQLNLEKIPKITNHIKEMEKLSILKILTPKLKKTKQGRVYGLTDKGKKIKKFLCIKEKIPFIYCEPEKFDWYTYGWCLTGSQKKAVICALNEQPLRQKDLKNKIKEKYKNRNNSVGMSFQNINDLLQLMLKRNILAVEEEKIRRSKNKRKKYKLTIKGLKIKKLMFF